jgi:ParB-like chromosome segregation protein Spo0J
MQMSTTQLEVIYLRATSLKPDPRNPRIHSEKQVPQIAQSIESFGFNVPLLIDDEQKVIAGHGRLLAARKLGWDTVPAIRLSHLTESQRMAFLIADNRLTENSSWDERMLGEQLKILSELQLDFDLEAIGFEVPEIDLLIDGLNTAPETGHPQRQWGTETHLEAPRHSKTADQQSDVRKHSRPSNLCCLSPTSTRGGRSGGRSPTQRLWEARF